MTSSLVRVALFGSLLIVLLSLEVDGRGTFIDKIIGRVGKPVTDHAQVQDVARNKLRKIAADKMQHKLSSVFKKRDGTGDENDENDVNDGDSATEDCQAQLDDCDSLYSTRNTSEPITDNDAVVYCLDALMYDMCIYMVDDSTCSDEDGSLLSLAAHGGIAGALLTVCMSYNLKVVVDNQECIDASLDDNLASCFDSAFQSKRDSVGIEACKNYTQFIDCIYEAETNDCNKETAQLTVLVIDNVIQPFFEYYGVKCPVRYDLLKHSKPQKTKKSQLYQLFSKLLTEQRESNVKAKVAHSAAGKN